MKVQSHLIALTVITLAMGCSSNAVRESNAPVATGSKSVASPPAEDSSTAMAREPQALPEATRTKTVVHKASTTVETSAMPQSTREFTKVPEEYTGVRGLLMARHVDALPSREVLDKHPNAEEALRWLGENDDQLIVRSRALASLGLYSSRASESLLLEVMSDSNLHPKIRAGAVQGLAGYDLERNSFSREKVIQLLEDPNSRVAMEAASVLAKVPSARKDLERILKQENVPNSVKRQVEKALQ